ncbi:hypothetical protein DL93DRAFT_2083075 [Clavulina sp. PMI_390]|nr:hypothetical protein DL93DRAFT_2083075 [Clavulina sp. PMI_390]
MDKWFARTSNLYRHMRTCKGDGQQSSGSTHSPFSEDTLIDASSHASSPTACEEDAQSPPPTFDIDDSVRWVSPDPAWGPLPLASWTRSPNPNIRRSSIPATPMPISQRVPIISASGPMIAAEWTLLAQSTPSPSYVISVNTSPSSVEDMDAKSTTNSTTSSGSTITGNEYMTEPVARNTSYMSPTQPSIHNQHQNATEMAAMADNIRFHSDSYRRIIHGCGRPVNVDSNPSANQGPPPPSQPYNSPPSLHRDVNGFPIVATGVTDASSSSENVFKYLWDMEPRQQQQAHTDWASFMEEDSPALGSLSINLTIGPESSNTQQWMGSDPAPGSNPSGEMIWRDW